MLANPILQLNEHRQAMMKVNQFKLVSAKQGGVSVGGVYNDFSGHTWLLKEPQWGNLENGINEYVAGGLYQHLLGPYAPRTELVYDEKTGDVFVGSKYIDNFQTLEAFDSSHWDTSWTPKYFLRTYQGKPIQDFAKTVSAILFMQDLDAHVGNVGIMENNDAWHICKIDHGFAFKDSSAVTLKSFRNQMEWYNGTLKHIGFDNLYESVKMVANINYADIESIVSDKIETARPYVTAYKNKKNEAFGLNINNMKSDILNRMKKQIHQFKKIQQGMELEKAIRQDNVEEVKRLMSDGYDVKQRIFLFDQRIRSPSGDSGVAPYDLVRAYVSLKVKKFYEDHLGFGLVARNVNGLGQWQQFQNQRPALNRNRVPAWQQQNQRLGFNW